MLRPRSALATLAVAGVALVSGARAQITYGGAPPSSYDPLPADVPTLVLPAVDVERLRAEDAVAGKDQPYRFGESVALEAGLDDAGRWDALVDGTRVWRLRVSSPGAFSLSPIFGAYRVPEGAELYVYDDARSDVWGAFNHLNTAENGRFAVHPIHGSAITLEYVEPPWVAFHGDVRLSHVVHDYRDFFRIVDQLKDGGSGADGGCETDVNCPAGNPWGNQKRAVALIIASGGLCTGSLLNNTALDKKQLFITASHCGSLANAVFRFNYQLSGCGTGSAPTNQTVSGSTQLAVDTGIDYRLVRIDPAIPASYNVHFAGWDRTGAIPPNTFTVHHPQGGVKKISFDNNAPQKSGTDWRILQWDLGVTEPGSSGCPLYNNVGRFIGQLWGGAAACGFPFDDFFGRLDQEWPQIQAQLDPLASGATTLNGLDATGGTAPTISTLVPPAIQAVAPDGQSIAINGTNFTGVTSVSIGGVTLPAGTYTVASSVLINATVPLLNSLGSQSVAVTTGSGSASKALTVNACNPPVVDLKDSDPGFLLNVLGFTVTLASEPGDVAILAIAPDTVPSSLPGIVSLGIGSSFTTLVTLPGLAIPAKGWTQFSSGPLSLPAGTNVYMQVVCFPSESASLAEAGPTPPQHGLFLF